MPLKFHGFRSVFVPTITADRIGNIKTASMLNLSCRQSASRSANGAKHRHRPVEVDGFGRIHPSTFEEAHNPISLQHERWNGAGFP
jgi:hypothetical protein